jgi:hypothetical protein
VIWIRISWISRPRHRGAGSHIEVERCNHGNANHREQERANPLALNTPGSLSVSMNNLSCLSLHNDLYIWAILVD